MSDSKHIVVTGASSGVGAAITRAFADEGHTLYVCARRAEKLDEVTQNNSIAFGYPCDVSQEEQVREFADRVREKAPHVDALVNCAGGFGSIGPAVQTNSEQWFKTVETNLFGTYLMVKHIVPLMAGERNPRIINFSGGGALSPFPNYSAYAVSKAAVVRLTENLAIELAPSRISVNAVAPGFMSTEIHQATLAAGPSLAGTEHFEQTHRLLQNGSIPIELPVACVKFLLSDDARGLTGKTISASFDPWDQREFAERIALINQSDLYTMRRINPINLQDDELRIALSNMSTERGSS